MNMYEKILNQILINQKFIMQTLMCMLKDSNYLENYFKGKCLNNLDDAERDTDLLIKKDISDDWIGKYNW